MCRGVLAPVLQLGEVQDKGWLMRGVSWTVSLVGSQGAFPLVPVQVIDILAFEITLFIRLFWYLSEKNFMTSHEPLISLLTITFPYILIYNITQTLTFVILLAIFPSLLLWCTSRGKYLFSWIFSCSDLCDLLNISFNL